VEESSGVANDNPVAPSTWFEVDYLLWWLKPIRTPASAVFNNGLVDYDSQSGARVSAGAWLDADRIWGVDVSFFQLEQKTLHDMVLNPVAVGATPTAVQANNRLWGLEANVRTPICALFFADRLEFLAGVRTMQFGEGVEFATGNFALPPALLPLPAGVPAPLGTSVEQVRTTTQFYGAQVGLVSKMYCKGFTFDVVGKVALGGSCQTEHVSSVTTFGTVGNQQTNVPGGALLPVFGNGVAHRAAVAVLPEFSATGGYYFMPGMRFLVGYNVLGLENIVRAPSQVDAVIVNGGVFRPRSERFYAQGLNLGLELSF
jgi:hypothetical protein